MDPAEDKADNRGCDYGEQEKFVLTVVELDAWASGNYVEDDSHDKDKAKNRYPYIWR